MVDISKQTAADVRSKVLSAWNRLKYSKNVFNLDLKTSFSENSPVWLLAKPYDRRRRRRPGVAESPEEKKEEEDGFADEQLAFEADFLSRLWFTYRRNIDTFQGTQLTSDCGWGCMIRSGQMMFGQALLLHHLGREWVWRPDRRDDTRTERLHRDIVRLFLDQESAPLSIHNVLRMGLGSGKRPGDWFGPGSVAHLIQMAVLRSQQGVRGGGLLSDLVVYVAQDCTVYKEDILQLCATSASHDITVQDFQFIEPGSGMGEDVMHYSFSEEATVDGQDWCVEQTFSASSEPGWKAVVIFVPVRLGGESLNPAYSSCLRALLTSPACLGWIGGRPRHSLYFVGFQDDDLIHLDPHILQEGVEAYQPTFPLDSFHCARPRKISSRRMDPSCCLGFYLRTREDFDVWCEGISDFCTSSTKGKAGYPLFLVCEGKGGQDTAWVEKVQEEATAHANGADNGGDTEEFIFL